MSPPRLSVRRTLEDCPPPTPQPTPCRIWQGPLYRNGYGHKCGGGDRYIHRWVWELANGPIPKGMVVMHLCDNPPCYRLDHLQLGTYTDNARDMMSKGRGNQRGLPGEGNGRAKLSADDVREMRRRHAAGESQRSLAAAYGITNQNVNWIVTNRTWRNVA